MYNSRTHLWKRTSGRLSSSRACLLPDRAFSLDSSYTLFPSPFLLPFPPTVVSDNGRRGQLSSANKNHRSRHRVARYHHQQQQTADQAKMPLAVAVVARSIKPKHRLSKQAVEQSSESEAGSGGSRGSGHYTTPAGNGGPTSNKVETWMLKHSQDRPPAQGRSRGSRQGSLAKGMVRDQSLAHLLAQDSMWVDPTPAFLFHLSFSGGRSSSMCATRREAQRRTSHVLRVFCWRRWFTSETSPLDSSWMMLTSRSTVMSKSLTG